MNSSRWIFAAGHGLIPALLIPYVFFPSQLPPHGEVWLITLIGCSLLWVGLLVWNCKFRPRPAYVDDPMKLPIAAVDLVLYTAILIVPSWPYGSAPLWILLFVAALHAGHYGARASALFAGSGVLAIIVFALSGGYPIMSYTIVMVILGLIGNILLLGSLTERLRLLAFMDKQTGLPNRSVYGMQLESDIAEAHKNGTQLAVFILDLDRFTAVNASYGHETGDQLMKAVAERLRSHCPPEWCIARTSGDEMALIAKPARGAERAGEIANQLLTVLSTPFSLNGHEIHVSASIGAALYPIHGNHAADLIKNAGTAMHAAKEIRNTYKLYRQEMNVTTVSRLAIMTRLRRALERSELSLSYQPRVRVRDGEITGTEALLRWNNPDLGQVAPDQFIPIAEDSGLIVPIGDWVLREACRQHRRWLEQGYAPGTLAVNLSARQLVQPEFASRLLLILEEERMRPDQLELELTESLLMINMRSVVPVLRELKDKGLRISIDDFGTGYSSLSYLSKLPLDSLKIDRSFLNGISRNDENKSIVKTILALARNLHLNVVAEGVEEPEQARYLSEHGCQEAQGYYYSRPLPADRVSDLLEQKRTLRSAR